MRTHVCFVLPDVEAAHKVEKELRLASIQDRHMHFMAKRATDPTDFRHGIWTGLVFGGALGALFGFMISRFPQIESALGLGAVLLFALLGSSFGVWIVSMLASSVPNGELKGHDETLDADKVVPMRASRNWVVCGLAVLSLWAIAGRAVGQFQCPKEDIIATKCMGPKDCLYPNPDDCGSFIQCTVNPGGVSGTPVVMPCPAGLHWNNRDKICDWPANGDCARSPEEPLLSH